MRSSLRRAGESPTFGICISISTVPSSRSTDSHRRKSREHIHHLLIGGQHQRGEGCDALLSRAGAENLK